MMQQEAESVRPTQTWGRRLLSIAAWLAILYLVVAAVLAFVVPDFARNVLQQKLSPEPFVARIDKLRINPLTLAVEVEGVHIAEGSPGSSEKNPATELLQLEKLRLDISPWSLTKRAIGFDEIALIKPRIGVHLNRQQQLNWQRYNDSLMASLASGDDPAPLEEEPADDDLPRLLVSRLLVDSIDLRFIDESKPETFEAEFGPTTIEVNDLSTLVGDNATYAISAVTPRSELLAWNGSVGLNPLRSTGALSVSGWRLPLVWEYFKNQLQFEVADGAASISGSYVYDGNLTFADGVVKLENIMVRERAAGKSELIALPSTTLSGIEFDLDRQRLDVAAVEIEGLKVRERIDPQGVSMLASVLTPGSAAVPQAKPASRSKPSTSGQLGSGKGAAPAAVSGQGVTDKNQVQEAKPESDREAVPAEAKSTEASPGPAPATARPADADGAPATPEQQKAPQKPAASNAPESAESPQRRSLGFSLIAKAAASPPAETSPQPAKPIAKPIAKPLAEPAAEPAAESAAEPLAEPAAEPDRLDAPASPSRADQPAPTSASANMPVATGPDAKEPGMEVTDKAGQANTRGEPAKELEVAAPASPVKSAGGSEEFSLGVGRVALADAAVTVQHQLSASVENTIQLQDIAVEVKGFEFPSGEIEHFSFDTRVNKAGKLTLQGKGDIDPPQADFELQLESFGLAALMPYIEPLLAIKLESGSMAAKLNGTVAQRGEQLDSKVTGQVKINEVLVNEANKDTKVLSFGSLNLNQLAWDSELSALQIEQVELLKPFAKIVIFKEGGTNLSELVIEPSPAPEDAAGGSGSGAPVSEPGVAETDDSDAASPVSVAIGSVDFHDGTADFADLSLPRTFRAAIYNIKGSIKGLDTDASAAALVDLVGQVEKYAPVTLKGKVKPLSEHLTVDLELIFRNLELTSVSPYSDTYAGYNIDKGKLTADFKYHIADQKLTAQNQLVIDQLTLGERTDSATATSLPVALAVALLKDSNGVIDLNLPVSGDLDDPEFHYGALVGKALLNLVTKIVTAPFALLGSLVGGEAEDLDHVAFGAGESEFTATQASKLNKVAEALAQRPQLAVSLRGIAAPAVDTPALQQQQLEAALEEQGIGYPVTAESRKDFFAWFEKSTGQDVSDLRKELKRSQPDVDKRALDEAIQKRLLSSLLRRQKVGQDALEQLARVRSEGVREALVGAGVDPVRLFILDPEISSEEKAEPTCKLELDAS